MSKGPQLNFLQKSWRRRNLTEKLIPQLKAERRYVFSSYPAPPHTLSDEEMRDCMDGDKIVCLLCGKSMGTLASHLARIHRVSSDEYRDMYGIPYKRGLTGLSAREKLQQVRARDSAETINKRIEQIAHHAKSPKKGISQRSNGASKKASFENLKKCPKRQKQYSDSLIGSIVQKVVDGVPLYQQLKAIGMAPYTFHSRLNEFPELKEAYRAHGRNRKSFAAKTTKPAEAGSEGQGA